MICLRRHVQVHDGKRHEDKRLQGDNQDMENRPTQLQKSTRYPEYPATAVHQGDQDEDHFTCIKVTEQTQRKWNRFCNQCDAFQHKVDRHHEFGKWMKGQLGEESARTFHLDAVVKHQRKHRQLHAEGDVWINGTIDAVVWKGLL